MKKFRDLMEAKDTVVFAYGRFNPPTTGHEKLIQKVVSIAGTNPYRIYPSHSQNAKKDPLPQALKTAYMRKMFKKYARNIIVTKSRNAIEIAVELYDQGYKNLVMVAGSDRVKVFDAMLNQYNGVEGKRHGYYKFDSIKIVSAGERDPDSEGVEGMSASKMRKAASDGNFDDFSKGLPSGFSDGKKLYRDVRKHMGIREERDMGDMTDFESMRDAYLTGKIWNVGELVEANGLEGEIVRKGTNYLSFVDENGKVHKAWLHEIELNEEKVPNDDLNFVKTGGQFGKKRRFPTFIVKKEGIKYKAYDEQNNMQLKAASNSLEGLAKMLKPYIEKRTGSWKFEEVELDERNYAKEYQNYHSQPEQIARRSSRNKARRVMGDKTKIGMDVGHKDNDPMNNDPTNLRNEDPSKNRREPRLRNEVGKSRPRAGGPKYIEKNIKKHIELMNKYIKQGMSKDAASKKAYKEIVKEEVELDELKIHPDKSSEKDIRQQIKYHEKMRDYYSGNARAKREQNKEIKWLEDILKKRGFGEEVELAELWWDKALAKLDQMTHPKEYGDMVVAYAKLMKQDKYKKRPNMAADQIAREYSGVSVREFIRYINTLVAKKILPQELRAEYTREEWSFKNFVQQLQERELTDTELKRREEIAKDLSDEDFKKRYGDRWKEVKMGVATKMAKNEQDDPCWDGYKQVGMKKKNGKEVPNCVPEEVELDEKVEGLVKKSEESGISYSILKKVYDRGMAAWNTSHRPGVGQHQWAFARVNSFISGGTTRKTTDSDLWKQHKEEFNEWGELEEASEYQGKKVTLNKPFYTPDGPKKSAVYVNGPKGDVVIVRFGDPNMEIKRDDPERRKSFRARHNCDNPGPKWKARYWSCKAW